MVPEGSKLEGQGGLELDRRAEEVDVRLVGLIRDGHRRRGTIGATPVRAGDRLVVEGSTEAIAAYIKATDLQRAVAEEDEPEAESSEEEEDGDEEEGPTGPEVVEAVVRADSFLIGRSADRSGMRRNFGLTLLGIAHGGQLSQTQVSSRRIAAGDLLLLTGRQAASRGTLDQLGLIAVNRVSVAPFSAIKAVLAAGLFFAAIAVATVGWLSFTVAIAIAVVAYAALGLVPASEFYSQIEWPVVVMLACLLPLGVAFEQVGGTALIAGSIAGVTAGYAPVVALVMIMVVTMILSDVLNNVATMVITGPVSIVLAQELGANPDTFLMGVAISASCAFLTPIGHKNNTLIMGPGGFRFSDYWKMGLPLEVVVLVVAVPMLLLVWPL
jgi:di/tricarboxylate transporter